MKRVLIAGASGYIGSHLTASLSDGFDVRPISVRGDWPRDRLDGCDAVIYAAGLAHQRETAGNAPQYQMVNCDLALDVAREAKARGVSQFVYFSSMSVYGLTCGHIAADTQPDPVTAYGRSKWAAEQGLRALEDEGFRVAIVRPPMVYGRGCPGNYPRLAALAKSLSVFPRVENERSMLYIGTLCAFTRALVESGQGGLYCPQNREYVSTCGLVREVARRHGRRVWMVPGAGALLRALAPRVGLVGKVFGSLTFAQEMSEAFRQSDEPDFAETIRLTEVGE